MEAKQNTSSNSLSAPALLSRDRTIQHRLCFSHLLVTKNHNQSDATGSSLANRSVCESMVIHSQQNLGIQ